MSVLILSLIFSFIPNMFALYHTKNLFASPEKGGIFIFLRNIVFCTIIIFLLNENTSVYFTADVFLELRFTT